MENVIHKDNFIMKSFRLPQEQIQFLKSLDNASEFVRQAIRDKQVEIEISPHEKIILLSQQIKAKDETLESLAEFLFFYEEQKKPVQLKLYDGYKKTIDTNINMIKSLLDSNKTPSTLQSILHLIKSYQIIGQKGKIFETISPGIFEFSIKSIANREFLSHIPKEEFLKDLGITDETEEICVEDFFKPVLTRIEAEKQQVIKQNLNVQVYFKTIKAYNDKINALDSEIENLKKQLMEI